MPLDFQGEFARGGGYKGDDPNGTIRTVPINAHVPVGALAFIFLVQEGGTDADVKLTGDSKGNPWSGWSTAYSGHDIKFFGVNVVEALAPDDTLNFQLYNVYPAFAIVGAFWTNVPKGTWYNPPTTKRSDTTVSDDDGGRFSEDQSPRLEAFPSYYEKTWRLAVGSLKWGGTQEGEFANGANNMKMLPSQFQENPPRAHWSAYLFPAWDIFEMVAGGPRSVVWDGSLSGEVRYFPDQSSVWNAHLRVMGSTTPPDDVVVAPGARYGWGVLV